MKILVVEALARDGLALLEAEHQVEIAAGLTRAELLARIASYDALIVRSQVRVDAELLHAASRLIVVGRAGTGLDNIDLEAAAAAGVAVVNAAGANTIAAAEHTVALLYGLARHVAAADASLRRGEWRRADFIGIELAGRTLGLVGLGRIGLAVASRARAMEMKLLASDPLVTGEQAEAHSVRLLPLAELLRQSDVVSIHVPLSGATRGLISAPGLALMKPTALLVNTARGGIVDEAALADALHAGRLSGAALDVFADEPLPADSPLRRAPNTLLTPHLGASTGEAQARASIETAHNVLAELALRGAPAARP